MNTVCVRSRNVHFELSILNVYVSEWVSVFLLLLLLSSFSALFVNCDLILAIATHKCCCSIRDKNGNKNRRHRRQRHYYILITKWSEKIRSTTAHTTNSHRILFDLLTLFTAINGGKISFRIYMKFKWKTFEMILANAGKQAHSLNDI